MPPPPSRSARRWPGGLGLRAFTGRLTLTGPGITEFMTHPEQFLRDVYEQFGADQQAALALVYAAAPEGSLGSPLTLNEAQRDIIAPVGSYARRCRGAWRPSPAASCRSPFRRWPARLGLPPPDPLGRLRILGATQTHLLTVLLDGLTDSALLSRGRLRRRERRGEERHPAPRPAAALPPRGRTAGQDTPGAIHRSEVDEEGRPDRLDGQLQRIPAQEPRVHMFLSRRSSDAFLRTYLDVDPGLPDNGALHLLPQGGDRARRLARLHQAGLLSEPVRLQAVERVADLAIATPDSGWVRDDAWKVLLTARERETLMERVRTELVYQLEDLLPEERESGYNPVERSLQGYKEAFESEGDFETARAFSEALRMYCELPKGSYDYPDDDVDRRPLSGTRLAPPPDASRSIFDDIDAE